MKCKYCDRVAKNKSSNSNHEIRCPANPDRKIQKLTEEGRKRVSESALKQNATQWTSEKRKQHSISMKKAVENNPDSYTKNNVCGRVKIIEYNGTNLKGQWEVTTAKWLDSLNIAWLSEVNPQPYYWNDGWHLYYPDFYLIDYNIYIEVKGYKTERDDAKWSHFKNELLIVDTNVIHKLDQYKSVDDLKQEKYTGL